MAPNNVVRNLDRRQWLDMAKVVQYRKSTFYSGKSSRQANARRPAHDKRRYSSGMGYSVLSFDWNEIAYIGSPYVCHLSFCTTRRSWCPQPCDALYVCPTHHTIELMSLTAMSGWAQANVFVGFLFFYCTYAPQDISLAGIHPTLTTPAPPRVSCAFAPRT